MPIEQIAQFFTKKQLRCTHAPSELGTVAKSDAITPTRDGKILWHIDENYITNDLEKYKVILAFEKTFKRWQEYFSPIQLESTGDRSKAAIAIHFMENGNPALPSPFNGSTLAYAYLSDGPSLGLASDMYFNDAYQWSEMHRANQINLFKVAVHEVGHAFGLEHSTDRKDIMYPTYQPNDNVVITRDTAEAVEFLYGEYKDKLSPKKPTPPRPKPPTDSPEEDEDIAFAVSLLRSLFPSRFWIMRLTEQQILTLGKIFDLPVSRERAKLDNARIILKFLESA